MNPTKKVLLIRFSSIGDIVLTTPVIRCLKLQTGAEIHYLTKASFQAVVAANPYIDKIHTIKKSPSEVLDVLRAESYDAIIDLHHNLRSARVRWAMPRIPSHVFFKLNFEKWLMVRLKINRLPHLHIVDRYLAAAAPLGVVNDQQGLDYFIPPEEEVNAPEWLHQQGIDATHYVAFVIGAAHATKRLPIDKIADICRGIHSPVVLLGGPEDSEPGAAIASKAGAHVINACGKLRLNQSASMVKQAEKVITHDTGLMHIAAAFRKEIISVWGNTIPEFGMYPYYPEGEQHNTTIEIKELKCRPCSKIGYASCPKGHFQCMNLIDALSVSELANEIKDQGNTSSF